MEQSRKPICPHNPRLKKPLYTLSRLVNNPPPPAHPLIDNIAKAPFTKKRCPKGF